MKAETKQARRISINLVTTDNGSYIELRAEMRNVDEACKIVDTIRALSETAWGQTIVIKDGEK